MKKSTIGVVASMLFMLLTAGAFYYVWNTATQEGSVSVPDTASFAVVDISGIKDEATKITAGNENNAGVPIDVPTSKLGKSNPFNDPE